MIQFRCTWLALILLFAKGLSGNQTLQAQESKVIADTLSGELSKSYKSDPLVWQSRPRRLLIHGTVNDKKVLLMIDSGAASSLLTLKSARQLDLRVIDFNATFTGAGGTGKIYGSPVSRLQIGENIDLSRQRLVVLDLPVLEGIDGIVGGDTLASVKAIIDYHQHRLYVPDEDTPRSLSNLANGLNLAVMTLEKEKNYIFINLNYESETLRMLIDTGAQQSVIDSKCADRLKLKTQASQERVVGAGSESRETQVAQLSSLSTGQSAFTNVSIVVSSLDYLTSYSSKPIDGILGADCLEAAGARLSVAEGAMVVPMGNISVPSDTTDQ